MSDRVVVLGAGYAGAGAVKALERELGGEVDLVWVSETDYHLVLHEVHRVIRDPSVKDDITIPVDAIKRPSTAFVQGEVVGLDAEERTVEMADGDRIPYDFALVALGSETAFYGIPGLREHALTLKSLPDAEAIHEAVRDAAAEATPEDPASVVIGGAGLSGIQSAGEVAEYRDRRGAPIEVTLVEALDDVMPGGATPLQRRIRGFLEAEDVRILTDDPITEADDERVHFDERDPIEHDVLVWTGGITGCEALEDCDLEADHNRVLADATFETSDDRVFAIGDAAVIDLGGGETAPPTAQAAWDAAEVAAENIARRRAGRSLRRFDYTDMGTLISVGERAVAHDIAYLPAPDTFDSLPAQFLKKFVAARWIATLTSWRRGLAAWGSL